MYFVRDRLAREGVSGSALEVIMQAWRKSTKRQYLSYYKWISYCRDHHINSHEVNVHVIMAFLKHLLDKNYSYSAINTAKSALSPLGNMNERDTELLRHCMRGAFNNRPPPPLFTPKYKFIWDVFVLEYLESKGHNESMSLKEITLKLVMLLALTSGQRAQTLATLSKKGMIHSDSGVGFVLTGLLKTTSPKNANVQINLPLYTKHELCVVRCLQEYLKRTNR